MEGLEEITNLRTASAVNTGVSAQARCSPLCKVAALPLESFLTPSSTLGLTCLVWKANELHFRQSPFTPLGV